MRKHSDIALLRKMVQQKFKGVSEAPPVDGFEDIQNLLAKRNAGLTKVNKLFLGLAIMAVVAISSAIYFKDSPESSSLANQQNSKEDNIFIQQETDSTSLTSKSSPTRKFERSPRETSPQIKNREEQEMFKEVDGLPLKVQEEKEQLVDNKATIALVKTFNSVNLKAENTNKKEGSFPSAPNPGAQKEIGKRPALSTATRLPTLLTNLDGVDRNISADNGTLQASIFEVNSSLPPQSGATELTGVTKEAHSVKFLKADKGLFESLFQSSEALQFELQGPALALKQGKRVKYFYELQTFSAHFNLVDIDTENFISYNQDLGWSTDNLGLRIGVGMNYLFMKDLSFKLGVRYTHFSKEINFDVAKRVRDASIPINDQQVPVYHIIENRTDRIRHFGLGVHAGIQMKLGDRYLGVEIDYSKSLVSNTIGSTNLIFSGYFKLGSFWLKNDFVIIELHASRGLSSWKNDLLQYDLKQIGLNLKYPIKSRK